MLLIFVLSYFILFYCSDAPRDRDDEKIRERDKGDRDRNDRDRTDRDRETRTERDTNRDTNRDRERNTDRDRDARPKEKKMTRAELEALKKERVALVKRLTHGKYVRSIIS